MNDEEELSERVAEETKELGHLEVLWHWALHWSKGDESEADSLYLRVRALQLKLPRLARRAIGAMLILAGLFGLFIFVSRGLSGGPLPYGFVFITTVVGALWFVEYEG